MIIRQEAAERNFTRFVRVTKASPCKICGAPDYCRRTSDGAVAECMRTSDGAFSTRDTGAGSANYHRLTDGHTAADYVHPSHVNPKPTPKPSRDWAPDAAKYAAANTSAVAYLAGELGVPNWTLAALQVGYAEDPTPCWTFPERDPSGKVIGIKRRLLNGKKLFFKGSTPGLYLAKDLFTRPGPILLVEGGSDTAALLAAGCCVVGRPSNTGGVSHLVELLQDHPTRKICVIGEHDEKPDGRCPGKSGAISTATKLAEGLGRRVTWAMPPGEFKDAREWLRAQDRHDGADFIAGLTETVIEPPAVVEVEPYVEPPSGFVQLDAWREQMEVSRLDSVSHPGLYFDGSPTGSGKSFADRKAMVESGNSLILVPTHSNARELVADLIADDIAAVAYPERDESNCENLDAIHEAHRVGLTPGATVCRQCPHRQGCLYFTQMDDATTSDHAVATHQRFARQPAIATGKKYVAVHENSDDLLRPMVQFTEDQLLEVAEVIADARHLAVAGLYPDPILYKFLLQMESWIEHFVECLDAASETTLIPVRHEAERPSNLEARLWGAIKRVDDAITAGVLRAVIAMATGELHSYALQVDTVKGKGGVDIIVKNFAAIWQTTLPKSAPIWFADATGNPETIARLSDRHVTDQTPPGRLESQVTAIQVPHDITRRTTATKVAAWLRGVLASHPSASRIGIIGHRHHVDALFRQESGSFDASLLDAETRAKIHRAHHFGEGKDRGSNCWMDADLILVLGTPRIGTDAIRAELLRRGQGDAAKLDGRWGARRYEARTESGDQVIVTGRGYADPAWRAAHLDKVAAALIQAVGRGRGVLAEGVPVVLVTTEPIQMPIAEDGRVQPVRCPMQAAVDAVRALSERLDGNSHCFVNANSITLGKTKQRRGVSTTTVAKEIGKSTNWTTRLLSAAADAGLLIRSTRRKGGWFIAETPVLEPLSAPDTLGPSVQIPSQNDAEGATTTTDMRRTIPILMLPPEWTVGDAVEFAFERQAIAIEGAGEPLKQGCAADAVPVDTFGAF